MMYLWRSFFVFIVSSDISNQIIVRMRIMIPVNPYIDANDEKMKSVCPSGKYSKMLLIPFPK